MTTTIVSVSQGEFVLAANGDALVVLPNVAVTSSTSFGVGSNTGGTVIVDGVIFGKSDGIDLDLSQVAADSSTVEIGTGGIVQGQTGYGVFVGGAFAIQNNGMISDAVGVYTLGAAGGSLVNYGSIIGMAASSVLDSNSSSASHYYLQNYGSITANVPNNYAFFGVGSADVETLNNTGTMQGNVGLGNGAGSSFTNAGVVHGTVTLGDGAGEILDSTLGSISGQITAGSGGDIIVSGNTGGALMGGAGNDVLEANQTQTAATNAAKTTLDGGAGNNALYGNGAYTTFDAGDAAGGTNQVWGSASQMLGVSGYANNTLSFAGDAGHGVYVDLLNGHNAYVTTSAGNWGGASVFEDFIAAAGANLSTVPNVVGSSANDVIQGDKGVDRITGGSGADALYAGSGAASQDTFIYTAYGDSNTVTGYDTIVGFKIGTDKIDVSGFMQSLGLGPSSLQISNSGMSNTVYVEKTPGTFNSATDLAMIVNATTTGGLHASDFVL